MIRINLLPWRDLERAERKQEFLTTLGVFCAIAAVLLIPIYLVISQMIATQKELNSILTAEISKLDEQIAEIKKIKQEKNQLLARMNIIQQLQSDRTRMVHIFDELVRIVPDGVHFVSVDKKEAIFTVNGVAESNTSVSQFMRNIDLSDWIMQPVLKQINAESKDGVRMSIFQLEMNLKLPKVEMTKEDDF